MRSHNRLPRALVTSCEHYRRVRRRPPAPAANRGRRVMSPARREPSLPPCTGRLTSLIACLLVAALGGRHAAAEEHTDGLLLAEGGQARVPIVVSPGASE